MKVHELREQFLKYFERKEHHRVPSSGLIPQNDPSLLFTNAGMVQFKDYFLGTQTPPFARAVSAQKCIRAGGKHNDLENVGFTARHHTFFEMLGNFSFGDYFKQEAIEYAWTFITRELSIHSQKLFVSVFKEDDEAYAIWHKKIKLPTTKIFKFGEKDNFWQMADTGPCGPCSELYYDLGQDVGCGKKTCTVGCSCDRFIEIWNLVFMQFNRDREGILTPLPKPCVDTGAGLERLASVLQGKKSNYDIDLFQFLIHAIEKQTHKTYGENIHSDTSIRVIADHIRASTFLISEGVLPSNEGRGYVLRRILRRAIRHGKKMGLTSPFIYKLTHPMAEAMGDAYPQLIEQKAFIEKVIHAEEERFLQTLERGITLLEKEITVLKAQKKNILDGKTVYKLYDTFGFPLDLIQIIAEEHHLKIDEKQFEIEMEEQRKRARAGWIGSGEQKQKPIYQKLYEKIKTKFLGYEITEASSKVKAILFNENLVEKISFQDQPLSLEVIFAETPFYGEGGGQMGDTGFIRNEETELEVKDTKKPFPHLILHQVLLKKGTLKVGQAFTLSVDRKRRKDIMLNHTATHMLHHALQTFIGEHVRQAGSLVAPDRLRFDFTHFSSVTERQWEQLESWMNERIAAQDPVTATIMSHQEALDIGAIALFGEKYENQVRVLQIGNYSTELCGGTHLHNTGEIRLFKIISETAVAAGIRRIEAVTGDAALQYFSKRDHLTKDLQNLLKVGSNELLQKVTQLLEKLKEYERKQSQWIDQSISQTAKEIIKNARNIAGVQVLTERVLVSDMKSLRIFSDQAKERLGSGIIILGAEMEGTAAVTVAVTKDLIPRYSAHDLIQKLTPLLGGKGGGRADFAQGGGPQVDKLTEVLQKARALLEENKTS
ncbi:MAG: alanine--tRNA ligase [Deltaproteobacteria bacterium]|nr:alanine--tRNA ligase [Deltaproteobacteria bacterium]